MNRKRNPLSVLLPVLVASALAVFLWNSGSHAEEEKKQPSPIRALMLTGGCCHDYEKQKVILSTGISERANVDWKIVHEGGSGHDHQFELLKKDGWWNAYDVVLYNICFARVSGDGGKKYVEDIVNAHKKHGVPAVALHCTFHSHHWRVDTDAWEELLGVTSPRHGKKSPIDVTAIEADHPVMKGFPEKWTTPQGELYHCEKTWDSATALAKGTIDGGEKFHDCIWVNKAGKARVFGTTIGHHNETMMDPVYLDLVTRGLLWSTGNLRKNGKPKKGYGPK